MDSYLIDGNQFEGMNYGQNDEGSGRNPENDSGIKPNYLHSEGVSLPRKTF